MSFVETISKPSLNYEEAMDMLLKSLEKSEVFQLRKHITKMILGVGAVLFALDIFIMGYIISLVDTTSAVKENITVLQQLAVQSEAQPPTVEPIPENIETVSDNSSNNMVSIAQEYYVVMNELMSRQECTEEWYIEYKALIDEYSDSVGEPDQLNQVFSESELALFYSCVETEVHGGSFAAKVNVANVILNRLNNEDKWGDTLTKVITSPNQFAYNRTSINESTKLAIEYAYQFPDTTQGAEYFNKGDASTGSNASLIYLFTDDAGHSFFKSKNKLDNDDVLINIDDNDDSVG